MMTNFGHAAVVLALLAGTSSASAQYYRDYDARAVVTQPVPLTQAQRTTIYRTIIPQGRGRQPIVRERIVTEPVAPLGARTGRHRRARCLCLWRHICL